MFIERSINSVQPAHLKSNTSHFNHNGEAFHDIFLRSLSNKSSSRPPKIEVTGVLVPISKIIGGHLYRFKLESNSSEYLLSMNNRLEGIAKKIELEEVTVKGYFNLDSNALEVEKITVSQASDPLKAEFTTDDSYFDTDYYERAIAKRGKLEPAFDYLAS